jgi:hypothetical protein
MFPCRQSPSRKQQQQRLQQAGRLQDQLLLRKAQMVDQQANAVLT